MHKNLRNIRSCFKIFANLFIDYRFKVKFQLGSRKWTHDKKKKTMLIEFSGKTLELIV